MNIRMLSMPLIAVIVACSPPSQDRKDDGSAQSAIESAIDEWASAYEQGNADAIARLYTADGIYAANTGEVLTGREAIRDGIAAWIAQRPPNVQVALESRPVRLQVADGSGHALLRFVVRAVSAGCTIQTGHALVVWRPQVDGAWLIATQVVNRDPQPAADACSRSSDLPDEAGS